MFDRILSPRGTRVQLISAFLMIGYVLWQSFTHSGIIGWIDQLQFHLWQSNRFEFSVIVLLIPIIFLSFFIGLVYDLLTGQGVFANRDEDDAGFHADYEMKYQETTRKEFIDQVRSKYQPSISALKLLGFEELKFYSELSPWFGVTKGLLGLLGVLGVLANHEITAIGKNLNVKIFLLSMVSREHFTYAAVLKIGISFYTSFTDGTCIISSNYQGAEIQDDFHKIYKISRHRAIETAWADHQQWVEKLVAEGKQITERVSFADYVALSERIDDYFWKQPFKVKLAPNEYEPSFASSIVLAVFSALIQGGIIAACFFLVIFLLNIVNRIYPQCWFVRNIHFDFIQFLLLLPGCIGFIAAVWLLARFQHRFRNNVFALNSNITRLLGRTPASNSKTYVVTEWIGMIVPLLPVRSYLIIGEYVDPFTKARSYKTLPFFQMEWGQIKATFRQARVGYLIFVIVLLALPLWAIWECK